jgi:hypothetical protein
VSLFAPLGDFFDSPGKAGFPHGQGVQGNIRPAPGVSRRREIVGVYFPVYFKNPDLYFFFQGRAGSEPNGRGPVVDDVLGGFMGFSQR